MSTATANANHAPFPIVCDCGAFRAELDLIAPRARGTCYCADCQAFAYALHKENEVLDRQGGTVIVQTSPRALRITAGAEHLGCLRLGPNGLARWYATCCDTPIGNTSSSASLAFVGLVGRALRGPLDVLGPDRMRVYTASARGTPKPQATSVLPGIVGFLRILLASRRLKGTRPSPFFDDAGRMRVTPRVLSAEERAEVEARRTAAV